MCISNTVIVLVNKVMCISYNVIVPVNKGFLHI